MQSIKNHQHVVLFFFFLVVFQFHISYPEASHFEKTGHIFAENVTLSVNIIMIKLIPFGTSTSAKVRFLHVMIILVDLYIRNVERHER